MDLQTPNYNPVTRHRNDQSRLLTYANQNRNEGFFNDVTIGVGNQCFSANRMVLSCYSDYFQNKFRTKTNYQESIKLNDVDEKSIKLIIDYIYSAIITIDKQNVVDLLKAAHLLKMNDVKEFCFEYLESTINSDNCIGRFNLAKQYENESLLNKYYQHLSNHFDEVSDQIEFKNLSAADLESCGQTMDDDQTVTNKVWQMDLSNETLKWEEISSMNEKRQKAPATIYHGTLIVSNGADGKHISGTTEIYRKTFNQWKTISPLQQMRMSHAMVVCDGCLLVIGEWYNKQVLSSVEQLPDLASTWEYVASLQTPRKWLAAVNCKDCDYAIAGQSGDDKDTRLKSVEKYDADANKWVYVSDMRNERSSNSACVLQNKIYVVAGLNSKGNVVKEIECYDPSTDVWKDIGKTIDILHSHSLVVI